MYLKFLVLKLANVSNKYILSVHKRLLRSTINKCNKELEHVLKELGISKNFLSKQLSTTDFYILKKPIISHNNKLLQKLLYTQQKKIIFTDKGLQLTCIHS